MITILDAVEAFDKRKLALLGGDAPALVQRDGVGLLTVGLDVDPEEMERIGTNYAIWTIYQVGERDHEPVAAIAGTWADGFVTGLLLADLRAKEAAQQKAAKKAAKKRKGSK